jgi:hypothetical protein
MDTSTDGGQFITPISNRVQNESKVTGKICAHQFALLFSYQSLLCCIWNHSNLNRRFLSVDTAYIYNKFPEFFQKTFIENTYGLYMLNIHVYMVPIPSLICSVILRKRIFSSCCTLLERRVGEKERPPGLNWFFLQLQLDLTMTGFACQA